MKQEMNTDCTGGNMSNVLTVRSRYFLLNVQFKKLLHLGSNDPIKE